MDKYTAASVAAEIDHTDLKADALPGDIERLCSEAKEHGFGAVCVNPARIEEAKALLSGSGVKVCAVIGFPLGQNTLACKLFELTEAAELGADEVDYVINVAAARAGDLEYVRREMSELTKAAHARNIVIKAIFENCYLSSEDIAAVSAIALEVRPDFIKTSTGFGTGGARVEDVALMKSVVGDAVKIKAAGGIRDWAAARAMLEAGAERIGASAGISIIRSVEE